MGTIQSRGLLALAVCVILVGLAVYLFHRDPSAGGGGYPECTLRRVTGLYCAGCGMTRASHALLHLRLAEALAYNPLIVATTPFILGSLLLSSAAWLCGDRYRGPRVTITKNWAIGFLIVILVYTVLRNIPRWPFTLLAPPSKVSCIVNIVPERGPTGDSAFGWIRC